MGCLVQEAIRGKMGGNATAFSTVVDGQHTLRSGDALRLATKPVMVGRALYFVVGQVGQVLQAHTPSIHCAVFALYSQLCRRSCL